MTCNVCFSPNDPCYCEESKPVLSILLDTILRIEDLEEIFTKKTELTLLDLALQGRERLINSLRYAVCVMKTYEHPRVTTEHDLIIQKESDEAAWRTATKLGDVTLQSVAPAQRARLLARAPAGVIEGVGARIGPDELRDKMKEFIFTWDRLRGPGRPLQYRVSADGFNIAADSLKAIEVGKPLDEHKDLIVQIGSTAIPWQDVTKIEVEVQGTPYTTEAVFDVRKIRDGMDASDKAKYELLKAKNTIHLMGNPASWQNNILQLGIDLKTPGVMVSQDPATPDKDVYMIQVPGKSPYIVPATDIALAEDMKDHIWMSPTRYA